MTNKDFKILIVDDIPKNIQILGGILMAENYDIYIAKDGKSALTQVDKVDFDLILLDIMMPEMDGYEVCEIIKQNPAKREIPIIFLTAKTDEESIVKAFEMDAVDYVTKPFNVAELLARVKTHLKLRYSQKKLISKNHELQQAIDTKNKFFSIISHDLRSPLSALVDLSGLMQDYLDDYNSDELRATLNLIHESSEGSLNLLENLLVWARAQTGSLNFEPYIIEVKPLLISMQKFYSHVSQKKDISIDCECDDNIYAFADEKMVRTIIRNLINNAIKFTKIDGKILLNANLKNDEIHISIRDNGVGIDKDRISLLFREDVQSSTKGTEQESGTGLGLILVDTFVKINGGKIVVKSEENKGTIFSFTLPLPTGSED